MNRIFKRSKNRSRRELLAVAVMLVVALVMAWSGVERMTTPGVVVRVLFSETASGSARERELVLGVMRNRIANPAFGNCRTLEAVAAQPGAFSCVGDVGNGNWWKSAKPSRLTRGERAVWDDCLDCLRREIRPAKGPSGRALVYYHDRSIEKPRTWDNAGWRAVREVGTERFVFYSVVRVEGGRR